MVLHDISYVDFFVKVKHFLKPVGYYGSSSIDFLLLVVDFFGF